MINGQDAKETWGMSLSDGALTALMTPPPLKERVVNKSRLQNGSRVVTTTDNEKVDERRLTIPMHILAKNEEQFLTFYNNFCNDVLKKGYLKIEVSIGSFNKTYHTYYESCNQYTQFYGGMAKFQLKLVEPNPET